MTRPFANRVILMVAIVIAAQPAVADEERMATRGSAHQKALDQVKLFEFSESDASMLFSLSQFGGNCQVQMIYDPTDRVHIMFRFVRDEKLLFEVEGHTQSVFRTKGNVMYFAHFSPWAVGCVVTAHDLDSGKKLWETKLKGIGGGPSFVSAYRNRVTISVGSRSEIDVGDEASIYICGNESFGDYIEVLDSNTGKILANKVYREGYGK